MSWKPIYAVLIFTSTLVTYVTSLLIEKNRRNTNKKKAFLIISFIINFGILFIFKYYNFINSSIFSLFEYWGIRWQVPNLDVLLPVGISFYTFQAVGYTIDVYRGTIRAERHLGMYALFVSFFPQLVAGPIERATNLLPQFRQKFDFDYDRVVSGLKLMMWGMFMKVVVADRVATYVDAVYNNVPQHSGSSLIIVSVLFAIQIYCDFAGYSTIAIGSARVMGFTLMQNFNRPYFARSIKEFWSRWHISLSTWFKDYLYIPLGGNRVKFTRHLFNLFITFFISGIWHGANWTFLIWGSLHGMYLVIETISRKYFKINTPYVFDLFKTLILVLFAWIFFRANNVADAFLIVTKIFTEFGQVYVDLTVMSYIGIGVGILLMKEIKDEFGFNLSLSNSKHKSIRFIYYISMISLILLLGVFDNSQFIYIQF